MSKIYLTHQQIVAERKQMVKDALAHIDRVAERIARSLGQGRRRRNEEFYKQLGENDERTSSLK